jgi:hypothetical protein
MKKYVHPLCSRNFSSKRVYQVAAAAKKAMEDFKRDNPEIEEKDLQVELPKAGPSTRAQLPGLHPNNMLPLPGGAGFLGGVVGGPQIPMLPNYNLNFGADRLGYPAFMGDHRALQMLGPVLQPPPPHPFGRRRAVAPRRR